MNYHVVDGLGGQWLAEEMGDELIGIGRVDDILREAGRSGDAIPVPRELAERLQMYANYADVMWTKDAPNSASTIQAAKDVHAVVALLARTKETTTDE